jgi:citrate lyase beta subunit
MDINYKLFKSIKGEFEAEGLSREELASEALFAARNGLNYLVKISGAEAKSDIRYLANLGINAIVCPMIETEFSMKKYMEMLPVGVFEHVGVTIETFTAVDNINSIIQKGVLLNELTIGRTDLTSSWGGDSVDTFKTIEMVKIAAKAGRAANLKVTMGGSISSQTRELLQGDAELRDLIDNIETRKAVMSLENFLKESTLSHALQLEEVLLNRRVKDSQQSLKAASARLAALSKRN